MSKHEKGRFVTISTLKRIGTYLWIGIINPGPPPLPKKKKEAKQTA